MLVPFSEKFWKVGRVAICLAEHVLLAVLALEVEHVNCKSYVRKVRVILDNFCNLAVIVKKDMFRHRFLDPIGPFYHFLLTRHPVKRPC